MGKSKNKKKYAEPLDSTLGTNLNNFSSKKSNVEADLLHSDEEGDCIMEYCSTGVQVGTAPHATSSSMPLDNTLEEEVYLIETSKGSSVSSLPTAEPYKMEKKLDWASLFKQSNRQHNKGFQLPDFRDHKTEVRFKPEDLNGIEEVWGYCLVGFFAGRFPNRHVIYEAKKSWTVKNKFYLHQSGWIIFRFESNEDRKTVLDGGPYMAYGRQLMLKNMPHEFDFSLEQLSIMPIWVVLPGIPLCCWNPIAIGKITSKIGKPMVSDMVTALRERPAYARVLVEVDISKELPKLVKIIMPSGSEKNIPVIYEFVPQLCKKCCSMGHDEDQCPLSPQPTVKIGTPKGLPNEPKLGTLKHVGQKQAKGTVTFADMVKRPKMAPQAVSKPTQREGKQHFVEPLPHYKPNGPLKIHDNVNKKEEPKSHYKPNGPLKKHANPQHAYKKEATLAQQPPKNVQPKQFMSKLMPKKIGIEIIEQPSTPLAKSPKSGMGKETVQPITPVEAEPYDGRDDDGESDYSVEFTPKSQSLRGYESDDQMARTRQDTDDPYI